jgi:DNA repair photolyase
MKEYKGFYKEVEGNEGNKCHYSTRLDTYGKGCAHDCKYCYAKSLLNFRGLWDAADPAVADIDKIRKRIKRIPAGTPAIRLGGMTDCFQPAEQEHRVTYKTIEALNEHRQPYLIVTKSDLVADYIPILDKDLAHVQVTVTSTGDSSYEKAPSTERRIKAIEKLQAAGIDVQLRLSPYIPQFIDPKILNAVECDKILVEFLRVNHWIKKWFDLDYSGYTVKQSGYQHLPLWRKLEYLSRITGFKELSVCEDETEAYEYWRKFVNHNSEDCCNLRVTV